MKERPSELLEEVRDKWTTRAAFLEEIHGNDCPIAKAIRMCIGESAAVQWKMEDYEKKANL